MAPIRPIAIIALSGLVVAAHFSLPWQAEASGAFNFDDIFNYTNRILPNSEVPLRLPQTGIAVVDNYFAFMMAFFYTAIDTKNVQAHLQAQPLLGTLSGIWMTMLAEAYRGTASNAFIATTYFLEVMGELLGIGLFTPIWGICHLLMTSPPSASSPSKPPRKGSLKALGYAILLGHIVPTALMLQLPITGRGLVSQQLWTILRLFHPIFVYAVYAFLSPFVTTTSPGSTASVRKFFTFAIIASAFFHISLIGVAVNRAYLTSETISAVNVFDLIVPYPYWLSTRQVSWETGVAVFLQWDNILSASAIVVWAVALYAEAGAKLDGLVQGALVGVLTGPAGAAAYLMNEREDVLRENDAKQSEKKRQ